MKEIVNTSYKDSDLTAKIIGCAMKFIVRLAMDFRRLFIKDV
jgi:hypothetical protein